jgi:hypothetical protein
MRQLTSIHQQIDHKIRIERSRRSNVLKHGCTKSAEEPILDAHFPVGRKPKIFPKLEFTSHL